MYCIISKISPMQHARKYQHYLSYWLSHQRPVHHPSTKTGQPIRSQPLVWQWRWKLPCMLSVGLPQEDMVRSHMPSSSHIHADIQLATKRETIDWHVSMFNIRSWRLLWMYCTGHTRTMGNDREEGLAGKLTTVSLPLLLLYSDLFHHIEDYVTVSQPSVRGCAAV